MLSVSTMALAAMMGSACGTNMANINQYHGALNSLPQGRFCENNNTQELDCILSQMGVEHAKEACSPGIGC